MELWPGALEAWSANAAPGCEARVSAEGGALRFAFRIEGPAAWAIVRREGRLALPEHYVLRLRVRGDAPPVQLQVKLVDETGANVWWWRCERFAPPPGGALLVLRRASLAFAWGPRSGGAPDRLGAVELAVAEAEGAGALLVDELALEERTPASGPLRAERRRGASGLEVDLGARREWGGLALDFAGDAAPATARLLVSDDGADWRESQAEPRAAGRRLWLRGELESRFARVEGLASEALRVAAVPLELALAPVRHAEALARAAPRGRYPRHLLGEHADWTVAGGDGDGRTALLGADGALEVAAESFTLEPFLWTAGRLHGWADVAATPSLAEGALPIPSLAWDVAGLRLRITAFVCEGALVARYEASNPGGAPREARLVLALRPFQVTPAWQSLGFAGAVAPITRLERNGDRVVVNGAHVVSAVTRPDAFGAALSEEGFAPAFEKGALPRDAAEDPLGFAEGALAWELRLAPGGSETIAVALGAEAPAGLARADAARWADERRERVTAHWRARLTLPIALPPAAAAFEESLRASVAWNLVLRDGPRLQAGARAYRRSWIRDGALTATALAELGFADEARAFVRWYASHQRADGTVPCAVGPHGVDSAVEHDSHGQLAWSIVEVFRLTGDRAFLRELWPHAARAAGAITRLCEAESGLLPASISHEGYASQPVHSYWDDFFALAGLAAAADGAAALADTDAAARFAAAHDGLARSIRASLARTMEAHGMDVLPGSVELGDFDPSSSAIAFDPCGARALLPPGAAERTFARWWEERTARAPAASHSPYEMRIAAALLAVGWNERALALLADEVADQRPPGWRQWPEVAHGDRRAPRFLGDLPHGWVAAGFLRSVRRLFAYERTEDGALVLAAGVPDAWLAAPGVRIRGLPTHYGPLELTLVASGEGEARVTVGGALTEPPGGIVLALGGEMLRVPHVPAEIAWRRPAAGARVLG